MIVRDATVDDLGAITEIFNEMVASPDVVWRDEPASLADRTAWFQSRTEAGHPVLVACTEPPAAEVVGYGSLSDFRPHPGYWPTAEHSLHIAAGHRGAGVGAALLEALCNRAVAAGKQVLVAGIDARNQGSLAFHQRHGFAEVGRMPGVGRKFGQPVDLVLLQRDLGGDR